MAATAAGLWAAFMAWCLHVGGPGGLDGATLTATILTMVLFLPAWFLVCIVWHGIWGIVDAAGMLIDELRTARPYFRRP